MTRAPLAVLGLAVCSCAAAGAPETAEGAARARDEAIQAALTSAFVACELLEADKTIEREPAVDEVCKALLKR